MEKVNGKEYGQTENERPDLAGALNENVPDAVEKKKTGRYRKLSGTSIRKYFRELSIIIIGVLITLSITNAINSYTKRKEARGVLGFIKVELAENLEDIGLLQQRWEGEQRIFSLLTGSADNLEQIPADTLKKYSYAMGALYDFSARNESYELLKTSMLVQYVKDKSLLRQLSKTYGAFQSLDKQLSSYTSQKKAVFLEPVIAMMGEKEVKRWGQAGHEHAFFSFVLSKEAFRKFAFISRTILSPSSIFEDCKADIRKAIQLLEQEGF